MPQGPMKPDELQRYAEMIVKGCIAFRRGDTLLELVSFGHRDLAVAIAEAGAGAAVVLPPRPGRPAGSQGLDATPRRAPSPRKQADEARPEGAARSRRRDRPAREDRAVLDVARRRRAGSLGQTDRDERADRGVLHLPRCGRDGGHV